MEYSNYQSFRDESPAWDDHHVPIEASWADQDPDAKAHHMQISILDPMKSDGPNMQVAKIFCSRQECQQEMDRIKEFWLQRFKSVSDSSS